MPASNSGNDPAKPRADEVPAHGPQQDASVPRLRIGSPASLLAVIPFLLAFEPAESDIVVVGVTPPRSEVVLTVRYDAPGPQRAAALARHAAAVLGAQGVRAACAVGYGPGELVTPVADALRARFAEAGISVTEFLRVQDGRYWSYLCASPACCPPGGTPFVLKDHPVTRQYKHLVLASREALAATVAPVTGDAARGMRNATRAARRRGLRLAAEAAQGQDYRARRRALLQPGLQAVADAIALYRSGGAFASHKDAAWLAYVLTDIRVRDDAWARMEPGHRKAHLRLWTDLTVLARPGYVAAPATLLAFVAWQSGDGALGNVALDRALADNPQYSMALLLRQALDAGAPPSMARLPMTPEEVAAAYDQAEQQPGQAGQAAAPEQTSDGADAGTEEATDPATAGEGPAVPPGALADATA